MFINESDREPAMKALKDAAAKAPVARDSPVGHHKKRRHCVDSEDVESTDESDEVLHWRAGWDG